MLDQSVRATLRGGKWKSYETQLIQLNIPTIRLLIYFAWLAYPYCHLYCSPTPQVRELVQEFTVKANAFGGSMPAASLKDFLQQYGIRSQTAKKILKICDANHDRALSVEEFNTLLNLAPGGDLSDPGLPAIIGEKYKNVRRTHQTHLHTKR
ncbi:unnamed protein product [Dicrocoelium dendriticum]|nr:unnamed protein product [Dicrocoelium dendriticum]